MRVVLLTGDETWQRALANRIHTIPGVTLAGLALQEIASQRTLRWAGRAAVRDPLRLANKLLCRAFFSDIIEGAEREAVVRFGRMGEPRPWPEVPITTVADINGAAAVESIRALAPDLIAVSGTRLIRQPIFALDPPLGLVNLHTGISPYYKGGPNCAWWCLANHEPQFIGATLHALDPGIDSGAIFVTAQTRVEADDTMTSLASKAVATGHQLYEEVLRALAEGRGLRPVPQDQIGAGRLYLAREWTFRQFARAARYVRSGQLARWVEAGRPRVEQVRLVNTIETGARLAPVAAGSHDD